VDEAKNETEKSRDPTKSIRNHLDRQSDIERLIFRQVSPKNNETYPVGYIYWAQAASAD
jgi:hypothetical protein